MNFVKYIQPRSQIIRNYPEPIAFNLWDEKNVEVYDFAKQLSTPCSSRAILQTSTGFLGKEWSNDSELGT